ncbi:MAG: hypothetical protein ABIG30_01275 [Candidatus Aenigmatarchaeota archaeon]
MSVIGFNLTEIAAKVNDERIDGEVSINSGPNIESIKKADISIAGLKGVLSIEFVFNVNYKPKVGEIKLRGVVLYQSDKADDILKDWEAKKAMDADVALDVMNVIYRNSLTKAIMISTDLKLPPPIRFPIVTAGEPPKNVEKKDDEKKGE